METSARAPWSLTYSKTPIKMTEKHTEENFNIRSCRSVFCFRYCDGHQQGQGNAGITDVALGSHLALSLKLH